MLQRELNLVQEWVIVQHFIKYSTALITVWETEEESLKSIKKCAIQRAIFLDTWPGDVKWSQGGKH